MKKLKINLVMIAIVLGTIGAVAFKAPKTKATSQTNYYWFEYDEDGDLIYPTSQPTLGSDPFGCPQTGSTNCATGYTAVVKVGSNYEPSGSQGPTDMKNP